MNRVLLILIMIAGLGLAFAIGANVAGDGNWGPERTQVVTTTSGETVVIANTGWHGPPIGFLFIPLFVIGLFWLVRGRRGQPCGGWDPSSGDRTRAWSEWHQSEHEKMNAPDRPDRPNSS